MIRFDESVPKDLMGYFPDRFQVRTTQQMGWAAKANGELLHLASQAAFSAVITMDKRMEHEQNLRHLPIPVIVLGTHRQNTEDLGNLVTSQVLGLLDTGPERRFYRFGFAKAARRKTRQGPNGNFVREPAAASWA